VRCALVALIAAAMLALAAPLASAADRFVTTTADSGQGSLRDTIAAANPGDTIHVPSGTYPLDTTLLVDKPITIAGAGARTTTLDGQGKVRVLLVGSRAAPGATVSGVTITGGSANAGAGVLTSGPLTLTDTAIVGNTATNGNGGGIFAGQTLTLERDLVAGNSAPSTSLGGSGGGGIELQPLAAVTYRIADSTITGNDAAITGGGIDERVANGATLELESDTIVGNALSMPGSQGGNLFTVNGVQVTFHGDALGGGIASNGRNCVIAGSSVDDGWNVEENAVSCALFAASDQVPASLNLGPLHDNGGPTDTLLPAADSPLVDQGDPSGCAFFDQRGVPRPRGARCDVGAVERGSYPPFAGPPIVSDVTATSAVVSATAYPDFVGGTWAFAYGVHPAPEAVTPMVPLLPGIDDQVITTKLTGLTPGTFYTVALVVQTPLGAALSADSPFTTLPGPSSPSGPSGPSAPPRAPHISHARMTHARFRVSRRPTAVAAARKSSPPLATSFRFVLSAPAKVTIAISQGRHVDGKLTRAKLPAGKTVNVPFSGRVGRRALRPGRYAATLTASNAGGTARAVRLRFTVVR
jgi:predicted outer membrane repeat protein